MKIGLVIPARLSSKRLKNKVLINIKGLPIIEHVRRRALLSRVFDEIYIVTPDIKVKNIIKNYGGKVILSKKKHKSGTSRVSEITDKINCSKIVILFGDELLIDPKQISKFTKSVIKDNKSDVWNATSKKIKKKELNQNSIVKCYVDSKSYIQKLTRLAHKKNLKINDIKITKSVGMLAYKKKVLNNLKLKKSSKSEKTKKIEQLKVIENSFSLKSVPINFDLPSVNTKKELKFCLDYLEKNNNQKKILNRILKF